MGFPVIVAGGGPAGAFYAAQLAAAGRRVTLVDEHLAWEKPCGGGLTDKALRRYPFLAESAESHNAVSECELISPQGRTLLLRLDRTVAIFSRKVLNGILLERARRAGVALVQERIAGLESDRQSWRVRLSSGCRLRAQAVVVATGARNPLRAAVPSPLGDEDWMATAGYYLPLERLPWPRQRMAIRFLPNLEGYIWSFPRGDHASVGICGKLGSEPTRTLRQRLEAALDAWGVDWRTDAAFYAHLLPAPDPKRLRAAEFAGAAPHPWALVGDAAGLVDPITGEGLYYALRSAELLAQTGFENYSAAVQAELVPELAAAGAIVRRFYFGRFCGASVLERMTQFGQRSARFRELLCDLFSGAQGYLGLRERLWRQLAPALLQMALPSTGAGPGVAAPVNDALRRLPGLDVRPGWGPPEPQPGPRVGTH
ncbi:MAG: FAD-dependent oxidoreductase [Acidobacteria bacterium]|nr:MAG: FAD-dependent oxidoreductase [Acidobacteriota bacterium]